MNSSCSMVHAACSSFLQFTAASCRLQQLPAVKKAKIQDRARGILQTIVPLVRVSVNALAISLGKRKHTSPCSSVELFCAEKNGGPQRKSFGGGYGSPGFQRDVVSATDLENSSLRIEKFPKDFLSVVVVYALIFSASRELFRGLQKLLVQEFLFGIVKRDLRTVPLWG